MPNFQEHSNTGIFTGLLYGFARSLYHQKTGEKIDWQKVWASALIGACGGFVGSMIPDVLEPAIHPNHRGLAHSVAAGGGVGFQTVQWWLNHGQSTDAKFLFLEACAVGYLSHLLLDGRTPKGLPIG